MNLDKCDRISVAFPKDNRENNSQVSTTGAAVQTHYM